MPAAVRYRSTAAAYVAGPAASGTARARGSVSAPRTVGTAACSIATLAHPFTTVAVNAYTSPPAAVIMSDRTHKAIAGCRSEGRGSVALNP